MQKPQRQPSGKTAGSILAALFSSLTFSSSSPLPYLQAECLHYWVSSPLLWCKLCLHPPAWEDDSFTSSHSSITAALSPQEAKQEMIISSWCQREVRKAGRPVESDMGASHPVALFERPHYYLLFLKTSQGLDTLRMYKLREKERSKCTFYKVVYACLCLLLLLFCPWLAKKLKRKKEKEEERDDEEERWWSWAKLSFIWPLISKAQTEISLWAKEDRAGTAVNGLQRRRQMKFCFHPETGKQAAAMDILRP